jgi:FG-GAP-like repeat/FG-GAP repeat/PASTA domain
VSARARTIFVAGAACLLILGAGCGGQVAPQKGASRPPVIPGPSFAAPVGYATGRGPAAVAIGDLNGDGRSDLVTANADEGSVSVLLNRGRGSFGATKDYSAGRSLTSVAVADLNGDGRRDIVTTGGHHTVSVFLNGGDGSFQPRRDYRTGADPSAVAVGDLDGDGKPDVAVANGGTETVSVLLNRGDALAPRADYKVGPTPTSLAIADLNGDGTPDLATASDEDSSSVLLNRGDGIFRRGHDYDSTTGPSWVAATDLNGDGKPELAVASNDWSDEVEDEGVTLQPAYVYVFAGRDDGTFKKSETFLRTFGYAEGIDALAVADLNGDGKPDLVAARDQSNYDAGFISLLLNDGHGGFPERLDYELGPQGDTTADITLAVGDLNGDGSADVVSADASTHTVTVLLSMPGRCNVQDVSGKTVTTASGYEGLKLAAAKRALVAAHCGVGMVRHVRPAYGEAKGRVTSQKPEFGAVLPAGSKVDLVVSRGPKP